MENSNPDIVAKETIGRISWAVYLLIQVEISMQREVLQKK